MYFKIGCAPCCWGIEDASNPNNTSWNRVISETALAGYEGIELGPLGYLPEDTALVRQELLKHGLFLTAGTLYDDFHTAAYYPTLIQNARTVCRQASLIGSVTNERQSKTQLPYLVMIDAISQARSTTAGHSDAAPRLTWDEWKQMMHRFSEIALMAWSEFGVRAVVHPHAGGYVEFSDEIEALVQDISYNTAGLCLDTGHMYYSGMDPSVWLHRYRSILDYVHFKDINLDIYNSVMRQNIDFSDACKMNVMCPIGEGIIDYQGIRDLLIEDGYSGWITIEQERDPKNCESTLSDVKKSLCYMERNKF